MRVIQTVSGIGMEASGPSYSVPGLCRGLVAAQGVEVELHARAHGEREFPFRFVRYPYLKSRILPGANPLMRDGLKKAAQTADILHANGLWNMPSVYPLEAVKGTHCKLVVAPRGTLAAWALKKSWFVKKIFGFVYQYEVLRQADMFHATSVKEYNEIRSAGYRQPVAIVPIGMDLPNVRPQGVKYEGRVKTLAFFGRIHKVKSIDAMLIAWNRIADKFSDWRVVVAGPDCGDKNRLEGIVAEQGIPRVEFFGELTGQAKYDFLASIDLYCLPSETENFGVTLAEALACGVPSVASTGTPWNGLEKERCGRWVPNDEESLAGAFQKLMELSEEARLQMGARGRAWIKRDFSWEGIGVKMKLAYEWLLHPDNIEKPTWVRVD